MTHLPCRLKVRLPGEFAPSTTLKPGFIITKESGWAAMTITITVPDYEV
jgi:hypothetical protein